MSVDIAARLVENLPNSLTLPSGDTFTIDWVDGLARHEDKEPPYGSFSPVTTVPQRPRDLKLRGAVTETSRTASDTITFSSGTDVYQVTERDITSLNEVTGTLNGSDHTFTIDTDVEKHSTPDYEVFDAVKWLDGADSPDDGTDFTVEYDHRIYEIHRRNYERITYRLAVHGKELSQSDTNASQPYAAWDLAYQLGDALAEELTLLKGSALDDDGNLKLKSFENYGSINLEEGESTAVNPFDITMIRWKDILEADVRSIEDNIVKMDPEIIEGDGYGEATYGSGTYG